MVHQLMSQTSIVLQDVELLYASRFRNSTSSWLNVATRSLAPSSRLSRDDKVAKLAHQHLLKVRVRDIDQLGTTVLWNHEL